MLFMAKMSLIYEMAMYKTMYIKGKRVFAENLRYADSVTTINLKGNSWCFRDDPQYCERGGRYYTWNAAADLDEKWSYGPSVMINVPHRGICPDGWHLPTGGELDSTLWECGTACAGFGFTGTYYRHDYYDYYDYYDYGYGSADIRRKNDKELVVFQGAGGLFWSTGTERILEFTMGEEGAFQSDNDATNNSCSAYATIVRCFED